MGHLKYWVFFFFYWDIFMMSEMPLFLVMSGLVLHRTQRWTWVCICLQKPLTVIKGMLTSSINNLSTTKEQWPQSFCSCSLRVLLKLMKAISLRIVQPLFDSKWGHHLTTMPSLWTLSMFNTQWWVRMRPFSKSQRNT